jgi:chemotaxis protein methyltransferase CheR
MFFFKKKVQQPAPKKETPPPFDASNLDVLIHYVEKYSGVNLIPKKDVLKQRFIMFCEQNLIHSFATLLEKLKYDASLRQEFINLVTVNETYFMRETLQLEDSIEFLKNRGGNGRILSAPCASGEEVYSLAMIAREMNIPSNSLHITGIDINSEAIKKAQDRLFSERSLHRLNPNQKASYFTQEGDKFKIQTSYFCPIEFHVCNIFDDAFLRFSPFDVIFSRNMMIYFDEEYKRQTVERFYRLLKPSGRLYAGHADLVPQTPLFKKVTQGRLTYYEKV